MLQFIALFALVAISLYFLIHWLFGESPNEKEYNKRQAEISDATLKRRSNYEEPEKKVYPENRKSATKGWSDYETTSDRALRRTSDRDDWRESNPPRRVYDEYKEERRRSAYSDTLPDNSDWLPSHSSNNNNDNYSPTSDGFFSGFGGGSGGGSGASGDYGSSPSSSNDSGGGDSGGDGGGGGD